MIPTAGKDNDGNLMVDFTGKDLNLLLALRALLEEANVTRAGSRIQMGQSSMSSALSKLRIMFGDELLVRVGRDYELTPLARLLRPQVQSTLPLIERALGSGEPFDPSTCHRTYRLLMSDYAAIELNARFFEILCVAPEITLDILPLPSNPTDSEHALTVNDLIVAVPGIGIEGQSATLFTDHYVCLVDPDNSALVDGALSWEAFTSLPHAVCGFGQSHVTPADRRLRELGFARDPHVTTTSFLSLPQVIQGTDMVAVVPSRLSARLSGPTGTTAAALPAEQIEIIETLYWHQSYQDDPEHQWLRYALQHLDRPVPPSWPLPASPGKDPDYVNQA
jgi:DNA-binding transcriptional LysR family regulator